MQKLLLFTLLLMIAFWSCKPKPAPLNPGPAKHVEWSRRATIYEVNIRQFTTEGTFNAFEKELPRLQKMGVDILWIMPVHPLGVKNRKGSLGSYYAVRDYLAVNPEYGTIDDFKAVVKKAHELGMKVIIDWVANHTAWDNPLIDQHPDWYKKDSAGKIISPVADWTDVAGLDYSNPDLRKYMTDALSYWVTETGIDGYRCDVAGFLPVDYWNQAIPELQKIKPLFMLAEEETPKIHDTGLFDASYSWDFFRLMNKIGQGKQTADKIDSLYASERKKYAPDAYRMRFTSNHDENSWNGTEFERLGDGARAFAVLTFTFPGIPLIYTGQESAMNKRLRFFDKDTIAWGNYPLESFYASLTGLKKKSSLLEAGATGGSFIKVATSNDKAVYAFVRVNNDSKLLTILNLSAGAQTVKLKGNDFPGTYTEVFTREVKEWKPGDEVTMKPWEYQVYEMK